MDKKVIIPPQKVNKKNEKKEKILKEQFNLLLAALLAIENTPLRQL